MKVLLAGATGSIGIPVTRRLLAHGHQVLGLTRDPAGAVIHELTALRKPPLRHSGMALTNRLRTQGTGNLLAAAEALGARRFLTQSVIFGYGYRDHGPRPLTEQDPFGRPAGTAATGRWPPCCPPSGRPSAPPRGSPCATAATPPGCGPCSPPGAGCPWPGAGCSAGSTTPTPPRPPLPPSSTAAPGRLTTSSTTCQPAGRRSTRPWRRRSAPRHPPRLPRWLFRLAAPYVASFATGTVMHVANAKAKAGLGWRLTFPTYRHGIRAAATKEVPWPSHGRSGAGTRSA